MKHGRRGSGAGVATPVPRSRRTVSSGTRLEPPGARADTSGMRIREEATTSATPERAWELLSDPALHGLWNPRIVATGVLGSGRPGVGHRYRVTYELSGRRNEFEAEIVEFEPPFRFTARLEEREKGDGTHFERHAIERYIVTPRASGTHVRHEVKIHQSGVPLGIRFLVWVMFRLGKPTGPTFMEHFAEIAEGDFQADQPRAA